MTIAAPPAPSTTTRRQPAERDRGHCDLMRADFADGPARRCNGQLVDSGRVVQVVGRRCRELVCIRCGVLRAGDPQ